MALWWHWLNRPYNSVTLDLTDDEIAKKMFRTSGMCICETCGKVYYKHKYVANCLTAGWDGTPVPFLRVICNGDIVKL